MKKKGFLPLILGLLLLAVFALAAFAPELFTSYGQKELFTKWLPISREHLLGTNAMGYDIFTELIYGAGIVCFAAVFSSSRVLTNLKCSTNGWSPTDTLPVRYVSSIIAASPWNGRPVCVLL